MLLVGKEHVEKIGDEWLTTVLVLAAVIILGVAIFGKLFHKVFVAGYILLP
jgi:hypothetical protein